MPVKLNFTLIAVVTVSFEFLLIEKKFIKISVLINKKKDIGTMKKKITDLKTAFFFIHL